MLLFGLHLPSATAGLSSDLNQKGVECLQEGRHRDAIVYFESARNASPHNKTILHNLSAAHHYLASEYASEKNWVEAISNEERAFKFSPENEDIKKQVGVYYNNYALSYLDKERYDRADDNFKKALEYVGDEDTIKINRYNAMLKHSGASLADKNVYKAISLARDAISSLPERSDGYILLGEIYYQQDNFKETLANWNKALEIDPQDQELGSRIEKIQREKKVEEGFGTKRKMYFRIRYDKEMDSEYVWNISDILDGARREMRSRFNLYVSQIIPVIVYTSEQFRSTTAGPHWTLGLYDGKIRLMEQDISKSDIILRKILFHEYAHALLFLKFGGNIPTWLHEGFAQFHEPEEPLGIAEKNFIRAYIKKRSKSFSIESIDEMFKSRDDIFVIKRAYLESKLIVRYLIDKYGKYKLKRLLNELKEGKPWQEAFKEVYRRNTERFDKEFREYLSGYAVR